MSTADKWEVVGKTKGKPKNSKPKETGDFGLSKFATPLYDVSNTKNTQDGLKAGQKSPGRSQPKKKVKKPVETRPKYDYKTIEEGLNGEAFQQFDEQILTWKEKYPDNPMNICKDLVMFLDDRLRCPDDASVQTNKEFDFPICKATKSVQNKLTKIFSDLSNEMVECIFQQYINSMLENLNRDNPIWGHKLCIQALTFSHPKTCSQQLEKYVDRVQTMQNVPKKCLTLLWALGQSGVKDSRCGLKVWMEVMLPALHMKNIAPYCMHYVETILSRCSNKNSLNSCLQPQQFMDIAAWTFDPSSKTLAKTNIVTDRMKEIYPQFKEMMMSNQNNRRQLFSVILATPVNEGDQLQDELTSLAFDCLATDAHCFSLWRNSYSVNLPRTRLLLQYLHDHWSVTMKKMPENPFSETVRAFKNTNSDAARNSDSLTSKPDFHKVRILCDEMTQRLTVSRDHTSSGRTRMWIVVVLVVALGVGLVAYDITMHGGVWKKSQTYNFMESRGVLQVTSYVGRRLRRSYDVATSFVGDHVPVYWKNLQEILSPYVVVLSEKVSSTLSYLWDISEPVRDLLNLYSGMVFDLLRSFALMTLAFIDYIIKSATPIIVWIKDGVLVLYKSIALLISGEMTWPEAYEATIAHMTRLTQQASDWSNEMMRVVSEYIAPDKP